MRYSLEELYIQFQINNSKGCRFWYRFKKFPKAIYYDIKSIWFWLRTGYPAHALYSMDNVILNSTWRRFEAFKSYKNIGYPHYMTKEQWDNVINELTLAFKTLFKNQYELIEGYNDLFEKTMELYVKIFFDLWD